MIMMISVMLILTQRVSGKPVRARQEDNQEHIRSLTIGLLLLLCSIIIIITLLQAADLFSILLFLETPGAPWTPREELRRKTCKVLIGQ